MHTILSALEKKQDDDNDNDINKQIVALACHRTFQQALLHLLASCVVAPMLIITQAFDTFHWKGTDFPSFLGG